MVIVSDRTSFAPIQSTATTLEKIRKIAKPVSTARVRIASRAASNASSTACEKLNRTFSSLVYDCIVPTAPIDSDAYAVASAKVSCASLERFLTCLPKKMIGKMINGIALITTRDNPGAV